MKLNTIYAARLRQVREDREVPIERICTALALRRTHTENMKADV